MDLEPAPEPASVSDNDPKSSLQKSESSGNSKDEKTPGSEDFKYEILPDDYQQYDYAFKIIIIGNSGVGKSCLSLRGTRKFFEIEHIATVGFEFFNFNIKIDDKVIKLQIWDTCGQEIYRSMITNFYRNSSLAVIVYAINDYQSFNDIDQWVQSLKNYTYPDIKIFLVGNKNDLEDKRQVAKEVALKFKKNYQFDLFMETSAKTGFNSQELFINAAKLLYKTYVINQKEIPKPISDSSDKKISKKPKPKSKCC